MRIVSVILPMVVVLSVLACAGDEPTPTPTAIPKPSLTPALEPAATPNLSATIEAAIEATIETEASIESTVTARVEATNTAAPEEEERLIKALYDCIQSDTFFKEYILEAMEADGAMAEEMSLLLEDWDSFRAMMLVALRSDSPYGEDLVPLTTLFETICNPEEKDTSARWSAFPSPTM